MASCHVITPQTLSKYTTLFKPGTIIEVSSSDSGLRGSWYTATVIQSLTVTSSTLLVEYHNLSTDDAGSRPLREEVDYLLVRPIPPRDPPSRRWRVMEDVDAWHNDGWWEGVVTKVVGGCCGGGGGVATKVVDGGGCGCGSKVNGSCRDNGYDHYGGCCGGGCGGGGVQYWVFFRCSREEIVFDGKDLRSHREWVDESVWVEYKDLRSHNKKKRDDKGQITKGNIGNSGSMIRECLGKKVLMNETKNQILHTTNLGVRRNGMLKEPRRRRAATTHSGNQKSKK